MEKRKLEEQQEQEIGCGGGGDDAGVKDACAAPDAKKQKRTRNKKKGKKGEHKAGTVVKSDRDVYVTGLPQDITKEELVTFFSKCGVIRKTSQAEPIVKIYTDPSGKPKGDGLVSYFKVRNSMPLPLSLSPSKKKMLKCFLLYLFYLERICAISNNDFRRDRDSTGV